MQQDDAKMTKDEQEQWEKYVKDTGNNSEWLQYRFLQFIRKFPKEVIE